MRVDLVEARRVTLTGAALLEIIDAIDAALRSTIAREGWYSAAPVAVEAMREQRQSLYELRVSLIQAWGESVEGGVEIPRPGACNLTLQGYVPTQLGPRRDQDITEAFDMSGHPAISGGGEARSEK